MKTPQLVRRWKSYSGQAWVNKCIIQLNIVIDNYNAWIISEFEDSTEKLLDEIEIVKSMIGQEVDGCWIQLNELEQSVRQYEKTRNNQG